MKLKAFGAVFVFVLLGALGVGQAQQAMEDYLDIETVQVKPEKRSDFDIVVGKMTAANRKNNGDKWLTMETVYGRGNQVTFISTRHSYADVEVGMGAFDQALQKTYGKASSDKLSQDFSQCVNSMRSEIRHRRWDLSSNVPSTPEAYVKMLADARWLRTVAVHVRPGESANFEALMKDLKAAREKTSPAVTVLVSQAVAGQQGTVYYSTILESALAGFDALPTAQQLLGDEGYAKFLKANAETIADSETSINRFLPDLSNPPEQVSAAAPDFWMPKPAKAAAKVPAAKAAGMGKMADKDKK